MANLFAKSILNGMGGDASGDGPMDLLSDTIKAMLLDGYVGDQGHEVKADLVDDETSGTGYTAGGITLANKTFTTTLLVSTFDNTADLVWTTATFDTDALVIYDDTVTTPTDPLIMFDQFGEQSVTGADFTFTPHSSGLFAITVA